METGLSLSDSDGEDLVLDLCDASGNDKFDLNNETDKESEAWERRCDGVRRKQAQTKAILESDNIFRHADRDCDQNTITNDEEMERTTLQRTEEDDTTGIFSCIL